MSAADGCVNIKSYGGLSTGVDIFEGTGQGSGGDSPIRLFNAAGALLFDVTPDGSLRSSGQSYPVRTMTATGAAAANDGLLLCDATAAQFTVTLPAANAASAGRGISLRIVKKDATANRIAIVPVGADLVDGLNSGSSGLNLQNQYGGVTLISDGVSNWYTLEYLASFHTAQMKTVVGAYTLRPTDNKILSDATAGAIAVTLPAANSVPVGKQFAVKKMDVSANAVTLTRAGADTIEGANTVALAAQYNAVRVTSDGISIWYRSATNAF